MSIPEDYRRNSFAVTDCIERYNPALSEVPFDFEFGTVRTLDEIRDLAEMRDITQERRDKTLARYQSLMNNESLDWSDLT